MKNDLIRDAFNTAAPTTDQKARMRAALEAQLPKETNGRGNYQQRQTPTRRFSWIPAVAALFAVVILGGFVLGRISAGNGVMSPAQTTAPQTEYNGLPEFYTSPLYQAIQEWQDYLASHSDDSSESVYYPYNVFGCVNGQMQRDLHALCDKYGLNLQTDDSGGTDSLDYLMEVTGLKSIFRSLPEVDSGIAYGAGAWIYPDGSVMMCLSTTMSDTDTYVYNLYTIPNDSLFSCLLPLGAVEEYTSWDYTTQDGITLLLARKEDDAFLFTAGENNVVYVDISYFRQDGTITALTKQTMEAFAETIDFASLIGIDIPEELSALEAFFASNQYQASREFMDFNYVYPVSLDTAEFEEQMEQSQQELAEKYGLTLPKGISGMAPEKVFETLGIGNPVRTLESVSSEVKAGTCYSDGGFSFGGVTQMTALDSPWRTQIEYTFYSLKKGSFYPWLAENLSEEVTESWEYTTENGVPLILFRSPESACLLAEREDAYVVVCISNPDLEYAPLKGEQAMGEKELIAFAETFDFTFSQEEKTMDPALYMYDFILEKYVNAITEHWDGAKCSEADISLLVQNVDSLDALGYALIDLDGNGNKELIITDGNVIYDLYILLDDGPGHLLSSWERNAYYLCDGNAIQNVGSNSAASSFYTYYYLNGEDLLFSRTVQFAADRDPDNPWFTGTSTDENQWTPITEAEADEILNSLVTVSIPTTPLTEHP